VLFHEMRYSHAGVFAQTLQRAGGTGAALTVLPPWYDVDTPDALRRLVEDLDHAAPTPRRTQRVVAGLLATYPALAG
jgi:hypothetical protein